MNHTKKAEPFVSGLPRDPRLAPHEKTLDEALAKFQGAVDERRNKQRLISDRQVGGYKEVEDNKRKQDEAA